MGHGSKFIFPLPGRKPKQAPLPPPPPISGPLSKAQKVLGTALTSADTSPSPSSLSTDKWTWEDRSTSGISVSVSDTTASHVGDGMGLGITHGVQTIRFPTRQEKRWEEESDTIPKALHGPAHADGAATHDVTDASSLRRRRSGSTIVSYYDKSKLPLSISQQTSSSAMAKGLPSKAHALLDMDNEFAGPKARKKPSRLDLSSLLPKSRSPRHLKPDSAGEHVLGPDLTTKSPSLISISPAPTPPPILQRVDRTVRKKITKESLRERLWSSHSHKEAELPSPHHSSPRSASRREGLDDPDGGRHRRSVANLLNLYDHYEQRTFSDMMEQEMEDRDLEDQPSHSVLIQPPPQCPLNKARDHAHPTPLSSSPSKAYLAPFPDPRKKPSQHPAKQTPLVELPASASPSSLVSPPADCASISSRHTRTSKASKRTDRSLTDFDLHQNSVLALSSDSEDDSYEQSSKGSLPIPPLSDGQASPTSLRSAVSHRQPNTADNHDAVKGRFPKRTSFAPNPQYFPTVDGSATASGLALAAAAEAGIIRPIIGARSSSLSPDSVPRKVLPALTIQTRMNPASDRTPSQPITQHNRSASGAKIIMVPRLTPNSGSATGSVPTDSPLESFPVPPSHQTHHAQPAAAADENTPPLSPTSVDFYLQSHPNSMSFETTSAANIRSSTADKGSASSSLHDNSSGRFMAVTRQEEMLLAALRIKRARMRSDIMAEFENGGGDQMAAMLDHDEQLHQLQRETTNESSLGGVSRQSSRSTMRTETALTARPRVRSSAERLREKGSRGQILLMMDRPVQEVIQEAEPSPDLDDFFHFDSPMQGGRRGSSKSTGSSGSGASSHQQRGIAHSSSRALSRSREGSLVGARRGSATDHQASPSTMASTAARAHERENSPRLRHNQDCIVEDPVEEDREAEEEEHDHGVPRPDSPISPSDFPAPGIMTNKKQVRLSAVGMVLSTPASYKPATVEAGWWDDSG